VRALANVSSESSSTLIYATTHSLICVLDLRTMRVQQTLENARQHGPITALLLDRKRSWVLVGTVSGALCLWDLRFGLLLRSWRAGGRVHALSLHPTKGRGRWAVAALQSQSLGALDSGESTLAEVWDVERGALVERFVARMSGAQPPPTEPTPDPFLDVDASPAAAIAALVCARQTAEPYARRVGELPPPSAEARALVLGTDFGGQALPHRADVVDLSTAEAPRTRVARGFMLTGSEDRKLRLWDLAKVERTAVLSGLDSEGERPAYQSAAFLLQLHRVTDWLAGPRTASIVRPLCTSSLQPHLADTLRTAMRRDWRW
jgi:phosphoinositide-3-kinase regulatory subunit 4